MATLTRGIHLSAYNYSLGNLTNLELLNLSHNTFRGPIPDTFSQLQKLIQFELNTKIDGIPSFNKFNGTLPASLADLPNLVILNVNVATLSGPFPEFYRSKNLLQCSFADGGYCRNWDLDLVDLPSESLCSFNAIPECLPDCLILYDWIGSSPGKCCIEEGIKCGANARIISM